MKIRRKKRRSKLPEMEASITSSEQLQGPYLNQASNKKSFKVKLGNKKLLRKQGFFFKTVFN